MVGEMGGWVAVAEEGWRKGPWTAEEDKLLVEYVMLYGEGRWNSVATITGLTRNGKSCRLRWVNYLRPDLKKGQITPNEERIIKDLHAQWGNRWSTIARSLPGRTDNEIKNYWRTHFKTKPAKVSRSVIKSVRSRLLKRQQFHQQQQLQQQQKQEPCQQPQQCPANINALLVRKLTSQQLLAGQNSQQLLAGQRQLPNWQLIAAQLAIANCQLIPQKSSINRVLPLFRLLSLQQQQ